MPEIGKLIIVGAGAFGREVLWLAQEASEPWDVLGFLDDNPDSHGSTVCDLPVLGAIDRWREFDAHLVVAVGPPRAKRAICERINESGPACFATLVHSSVQMSRHVSIGRGALICAGSILTTQIDIGDHVIVNLACTVGHDTVMKSYVTLAPMVAASSRVTMGEGAEVGMSTTLLPGISIGSGAMIGMGSVVTKDVAANMLVLGSPAKERRELDPFPGSEAA